MTGSSPLARGTLPNQAISRLRLRLIPARAGNTALSTRRIGAYSAHPRSRGEHEELFSQGQQLCGSSPLARGTRRPPRRTHSRARLIPARAGNTFPCHGAAYPRAAHPRSRGEHVQSVIKSVRQRGSSPLARGTLRIIKVKANANRLIPARAGNTQSPSPSAAEPTAHPRSRGEHEKARTATAEVTGSSPLARGTRVFANPLGFLERLIPARAGNTAVIFLMISPPRLIPARAGNTPSYRVNRLSPSAHPRSRGEHP